MSHRFLSMTTALLLSLLTGDPPSTPETIAAGMKSSTKGTSKTVRLVSHTGQSFNVTLEGLRTRFCISEGTGPCYDYTVVYVFLDNCGVTAYPLFEITTFENHGEFQPSDCIPATQSATLSTSNEPARKVYLQDVHWSLVGTEIGTGETVVLPFGELLSFEQQQIHGPPSFSASWPQEMSMSILVTMKVEPL
jgi:hypothetical protein